MELFNFRIKTVYIVISIIISEVCFAQFQRQYRVQPFQAQQFEERQFAPPSFQQQSHQQFQQQSHQQFQQQPHQQFQQQPQQQFQQLQQNQFDASPSQTSGASCPEKNGRFVVPGQCDAYVECVDGVGEQKLCPEGLVFNPDARFNYPCGYPIDVNCDDRPNRQSPQATDHCPHQYGYFKIGDATNCGQFVNCADGVGHMFDCPEGLAFNAESYRCDWPDQVPDCDVEAFLKFTCPESIESNQFFLSETRFFRSPNDCQRYFICVNGRPRLQNCGEGNAFNELINACDAAENVTGCSLSSVANVRFGGDSRPAQIAATQRDRFRLF